jgi:hypothetical protein
MVAVDRPGMNHDLMRAVSLTQQFSASLPNVPAQNRVPILRHPDHMRYLQSQTVMAAAPVRFHPATLRANSPRSHAA